MPNVTAVAGEDVRLWCPAGGFPTPSITWRKNGQVIPTSLRQEVLGNGTLVLRTATNKDVGRYSCVVTGRQGQTASSHTFLHVLTSAVCSTYLWKYMVFHCNKSVGDSTWVNSITIEKQYQCTCIRGINPHQDIADLLMRLARGRNSMYEYQKEPPVIEKFGFRADLEEEARTQLSCMVTDGDLPFTINWLKDGRHLQHDPDVESKQTSDFSTVLVFKRLHERHSGAYTCEAANAAAAVNHTAILRVKPRGCSARQVNRKGMNETRLTLTFRPPCGGCGPGSGTALVAEAVVMDCSARGFPEPVITWMKAPGKVAQDFQPVVLDGVRTSQAPNGSLVLMSANTADAGWYMCQATNDVGQPLSKVVQLTVHAPARVVTERGRVTGHAGQTVSVTCEATGDDPLELTWLRHHVPVSPSHRTPNLDTPFNQNFQIFILHFIRTPYTNTPFYQNKSIYRIQHPDTPFFRTSKPDTPS
nr:Down syndrome cell adhesion molecule homolog [Penaeus vannamei]